MSANHTLPYTGIVPNMCIEISQKDCRYVSFNPSQGVTTFFDEFKVPYFPANKPRPVFSSENERFSILPPNKPNQKISLPNFVRYALHSLRTNACSL